MAALDTTDTFATTTYRPEKVRWSYTAEDYPDTSYRENISKVVETRMFKAITEYMRENNYSSIERNIDKQILYNTNGTITYNYDVGMCRYSMTSTATNRWDKWGTRCNPDVWVTATSCDTNYYHPWTEATYTSNDCVWTTVRPTPRPAGARLREIIQSRQAPMLLVPRRKPLATPGDIREIRARETLRRIIGDDSFRRFLKNAFIHVKAKSGKSYQIFTGHGMTNVFEQGQQVEKLCVVLSGDFAPTDSLLMRYLLILNDEDEFRKLAISHGITNYSQNVRDVDTRPLPEIFRSLKLVA